MHFYGIVHEKRKERKKENATETRRCRFHGWGASVPERIHHLSPPPWEIWKLISAYRRDKCQSLTFVIGSRAAWEGNTSPTEAFHHFNFTHWTKRNLRRYQQASSKPPTQQKYSYLQKHRPAISTWFCVLYIWELFKLPTVLSSEHCKRREFSAITSSNRLSVMWIRFIGHHGRRS